MLPWTGRRGPRTAEHWGSDKQRRPKSEHEETTQNSGGSRSPQEGTGEGCVLRLGEEQKWGPCRLRKWSPGGENKDGGSPGVPCDQEDGAQVGRKKIGGSGGPYRPRRRSPGCPSYLAPVGVGVFTHDALVVPDVLEGLAGETPARSTHSCAHLGPAPIEVGPAEAGACQTSALAELGGCGSDFSPES